MKLENLSKTKKKKKKEDKETCLVLDLFRAKGDAEKSVIKFKIRCHTTDRHKEKLRVLRQNQLSDR